MMNTIAVYVVVSDPSDVFFEQAWVSAWSLKHFNPNMQVLCVVDQDTYANVNSSYRRKALDVIDQLIEVNVPCELSKKVRSRWLKTSLREYVQGDFLFIDTDTVICDSLQAVDNLSADIMMVKDSHCNLSDIVGSKGIRKSIERISSEPYTSEVYYNSGVIYCKDTHRSHEFYKAWHEMWKQGNALGIPTDQKSLALVQQAGNYITELDGTYNSQIRLSINYLANAKILHFFNGEHYPTSLSPFFGKALYKDMQCSQQLTEELKYKILYCRSLFLSPSHTFAGDELHVHQSKAYQLLLNSYRQFPLYYKVLEKISSLQLSFLSFVKHLVME